MVSVTERVKTLFFFPLQPRNAGGGGGPGGDRGVSRARFPPGSPHLCGSRFSRLPPLHLPPTRDFFVGPQPSRSWRPKPSAPVSACCTIDFLSPGHPKLGAGRPACWLWIIKAFFVVFGFLARSLQRLTHWPVFALFILLVIAYPTP